MEIFSLKTIRKTYQCEKADDADVEADVFELRHQGRGVHEGDGEEPGGHIHDGGGQKRADHHPRRDLKAHSAGVKSRGPRPPKNTFSSTHHFQLHVVVSGVDGHAWRGGEHSVQEGKVGQAGMVGACAVHTHVQNFHQIFADQRHHQAGEKAG